MINESIYEFGKTISGIYSNKEQALKFPNKYAHINIFIRPLTWESFRCHAFYSEQSFNHDKWNPYRQSINKLTIENEIHIMHNYKINNQERFAGGGSDISLLKGLSNYKIYKKVGCSMHFRRISPENYVGNIEPGEKCCIIKDNTNTYLRSIVELNKDRLISEDSGYNVKTNKKVWGSKFGPLIFKKILNFDNFIKENW